MWGFRKVTAAVVLTGAALAVLVTGGPAGAVSVQHARVVSTDPANGTPHVLDGKVNAIVQVGGLVVVGGRFTRVADAQAPTVPIGRANVFAFDAATGRVDRGFAPVLNNEVEALAAAVDGASVYVGGWFSTVNGAAQRSLARLRISDGSRVTAFRAFTNSRVKDMQLRDSRLYVAGTFTSVNRVTRSALAVVDATTGGVGASLALSFSGPRGGTVNVAKFDITSGGRILVAIGNFTYVDGARRDQVAVITLGTRAVLNGWTTTRYQMRCSTAMYAYVHDLDISADGRWFVVVTTGGGFAAPSLCDTAARWALTSGTAGQQPVWVNYTGGDTLWSVAVTGAAVYVGGHQRWMDNPQGRDSAGPGAVAREGIAALDPTTGKALAWNPGRARGVGAFALYSTTGGLWVGSDTERIGGETHRRLAFMPLP